MKRSKIVNLIIKKSAKTYSRMIAIFFLIFVVISSYLYFYVFNQSANNKNFYDNNSAHVIRVHGKLTKEDIAQIESILEKSGEDYKISSIYKMASGILNAADDHGIVIYGLDKNFSYMSNEQFQMIDDHLYSELDIEEMTLLVPIIEISEDDSHINVSSSKKFTYPVESVEFFGKNLIIDYYLSIKFDGLPVLFTTQKTFLDILKVVFDENEGNDKAIDDYIEIEESFIYIADLHSLNSVVDELRANSYFSTSAFDSFKDFNKDLFLSNVLYNVVLIVMIILSGIYIVLTYKNYLKSQHKDIAIFKNFGYPDKEIFTIYARALYMLLGIVFGLILLFNLIIGFKNPAVFALITIVELIILIVLAIIITSCIIRKTVHKDVLSLLKHDKEFE